MKYLLAVLSIAFLFISCDSILSTNFDPTTAYSQKPSPELQPLTHSQGEDAEWSWQYPLPQGNTLADIYVLDERTAVAVGDNGTVIHTGNAGETWNTRVHAGGIESNLKDVHFAPNGQIGWIVGDEGTILHTPNGGESWRIQNSGVRQSLLSVYFHDEKRGWAVGDEGIILHTTNAGQTWQEQESMTTNDLRAVQFAESSDGLHGWAAGDGSFLYTADGGSSWERLSDKSFLSFHFSDAENGWAVSNKFIHHTYHLGF